MPNRVRVLVVREQDRVELERLAHSGSDPARMVMRARIVLLSARGLPGRAIAQQLGCTEPTVVTWRRRYAAQGLAGLHDAVRLGGPSWVMTPEVRAQVLADTVAPPLGEQGPWSARRLARWLASGRGIDLSHDSIAALWRRCCLRRDPVTGFTFRTEPALVATIHELVGLFVDPPWGAAVVRVGPPSSAVQVTLPRPAGPADDLSDALRAVAGAVTENRTSELRQGALRAFVTAVADAHPRGRLHLVWPAGDQQSAPLTALAEHPRIEAHLTCAGCSWLAMVDCFCAIVRRRADCETGLAHLTMALKVHTQGRLPNGTPFTWIQPSGGQGPSGGARYGPAGANHVDEA